MKYFFSIVSMFCLFGISDAQQVVKDTSSSPKVGMPMPDFTLAEIAHFSSTHAQLSDFKGKWLFLDFWFVGCRSCVESFPVANAIQSKFKTELNWVLVGLNDTRDNKKVRETYERFRVKMNLELAAAYDSVLAKTWKIHSMPHLIIVDPNGIVKWIISGRDITAEKIRKLIDGEPVKFFRKDVERSVFTPYEPGTHALFGSLLAEWNGEDQNAGYPIDEFMNNKVYLRQGYDFAMIPLYALYNYAYFGRWDWVTEAPEMYTNYYPSPVMEISDSSLFDFDFRYDVGKGTYNYSLTVPDKEVSKHRIQELMQQDLRRYFKYDAIVEDRLMPVWELRANTRTAALLKTKGGDPFITKGSMALGFKLVNYPETELMKAVRLMIEERDYKTQFLDATGLSGNIDIDFKADMTDFKSVQSGLNKFGMSLVKSKRKMKVIVLHDPVVAGQGNFAK